MMPPLCTTYCDLSFVDDPHSGVEGLNILVVEDSPIHVRLLQHALQQDGYCPTVARTGREAVQCLIDQPHMDLVIMDICLPELTGFTLLTLMQAHPQWHTIPVMVISGLDDAMSVHRMARMGVRAYLLKPYGIPQVRQAIQQVLDLISLPKA
jgi:CheY-like chemotaxis protein